METQRPFSISRQFSLETQPEQLAVRFSESKLFIGVPKESNFQEKRCSLTPSSVKLLTENGHRIIVESGAGKGAHYSDLQYSEAGAEIAYDKKTVFEANLIVKIAPLCKEELNFLKSEQTIFSPIHLPAFQKETLQFLQKKKVTAIAYEYLKDNANSFPVVRIMSEIAGSASVLIAAQHLDNSTIGRGILLGGISAIPPAKVVILGAGVVGEYAARAALGLGADVRVFDNSLYKLMRLQNNLGNRVYTSVIDPLTLTKELSDADVAIGAIHSESGSSPCIVSEEMVQQMMDGAVIVDVSIDQGGCFETSEVTTHTQPYFIKHGVIHYCVPNIASRMAQTASRAFSSVITSLLLQSNEAGNFDNFVQSDKGTRSGIYVFKGALTNQFLAKRFGLSYTNIDLLMSSRF